MRFDQVDPSRTLPPKNRDRIPALDGWRGVAILMVLISHVSSALPWHIGASLGGHGVALFFVLSGFLITTLFMREREATGRINLRAFYLRRFFRLMPVAWLYLATVGVLAALRLADAKPIDFAACLFFFRNFIERHGAIITGQFWSLSIEEQFYLAWPLILIYCTARRAREVALTVALLVAVICALHSSQLATLPLEHTWGTQ
jgi:peptidoglycan/LPS O-acetylase OafA/YrhL